MTRMRVEWSRDRTVMFLAHLDLARAMERSIRRARLPVALTQGFNPHPRLAFAAPLPLGVPGRREVLEMWLREPVAGEELVGGLNAVLPAGLEVLRARGVPVDGSSLMSLVDAALYAVTPEPGEGAAGWERLAGDVAIGRRLADLMAHQDIQLVRSTPGKPDRPVNVRPLMVDIRPGENLGFTALVKIGSGGNIRPRELLHVLARALDGDAQGLPWSIERLRTGRLGGQKLIPAWEL